MKRFWSESAAQLCGSFYVMLPPCADSSRALNSPATTFERSRRSARARTVLQRNRTSSLWRRNMCPRPGPELRPSRSFPSSITKASTRSRKIRPSSSGRSLRLSTVTTPPGRPGVLYHKLVLSRAPGVELPKVVSEGEQRCLSIAAFFAELSTTDDHSGIVFDDPVSSLDYKWREGVARRLVQEADGRQVIVFTHDVVFLLLLKQFAEELKVGQVDQHVRQLSHGAGVCAEELPWVALKVGIATTTGTHS